jgi:hypothetical protein
VFNKQKSYTKKYNRIKNVKLLEEVRKQRCLLIASTSREDCCVGSTDPHHIKSVGSGGHDIETNVIPLCRKHHTEVHAIGLNRFSNKYAKIAVWLSKNGWSFNPSNNKWSFDNNTGGVIL